MDSGKVLHGSFPSLPMINLRTAGTTQEVLPTNLDLNKVIRLLEDPLTTNLKARHLFVLKKLLKRNQNGFFLKDLESISRILNICADKVPQHLQYASFLCEALKICRIPFLKERISDEQSYAQNVIHFLSNMGRLMRVSDAGVRQHIVGSVRSFLGSASAAQLPESYQLQLLEHSDLPRTLLLSMAALENQPTIKLQLLHILGILSGSSGIICDSMVEARGAEMICLHMNEPDPSGKVLSSSSEILWNLLEGSSTVEVITQLSSMECVLSVKEAFSHLLEKPRQHSDLQLRNSLLVVTSFIAQNPDAPLVESFFAKQLLGFLTFLELTTFNSTARSLTNNIDDVKMKKLLLNLLVQMCRNNNAVQLYREELVMLSLLKLVKPPADDPSVAQLDSDVGSVVHQDELQLQALAVLASMAPMMLRDFMSCQGNNYLLLLLEWCLRADADVSQSAASTSCSKKAHMRLGVRALRSITSLGEEPVNWDLCDQGAISQLLGILTQMEATVHDEDAIVLETMSDIQLILSELCKSDTHRKELFGSVGVQMVVNILKKCSGKFYSRLGHNKLILSTVHCICSCILGCCTTECYFLSKDGIALLLSLLTTTPRCVHSIVLSTLLDLCENPNTRAQILRWRGADGLTAPRLLLQLWRKEDEELGVARNQHGGIADPKKPILSLHQQDSSMLSLAAESPSAAVLEVFENLRAKIYLLLCSLGLQELPGLLAEDHVTLTIVRRYLDFKAAEVSSEVCRELGFTGVGPPTFEEAALRSICEASEDMARRSMTEQRQILKQQEDEDSREEMLIYQKIQSIPTQEELTAKAWKKYVSKTSNYKILQEEKASAASNQKLEDSPDRPAEVSLSSSHRSLTANSQLTKRPVACFPPVFFQPCPVNRPHRGTGTRWSERVPCKNLHQNRTRTTRAVEPQQRQRLMEPRQLE